MSGKISKLIAWCAFVIVFLIQLLVLYGVGTAHNDYSLAPFLIADGLAAAAFILFFALKKGKGFAYIALLFATALFIVIALWLKNALPVQIGVSGADQGITVWRMIWRHLSPVLLPLSLLPAWFDYRAYRRRERETGKEAGHITLREEETK